MTAWTLSPQPLPRADEQSAVGTYNDTIFIIGGRYNDRQLTQYDTATDTLTDYGSITLSQSMKGGWGQFWTQIDHIVYIIDKYNPYFNIYNMMTNEYTTNWKGITLTANVSDSGCLASSSQYLFITGGYTDSYTSVHKKLQILNTFTHEWINNPPSMKQSRYSHSCVIHNNYLWVFGGSQIDYILNTNERISTVDITQNTWESIDTLSIPLYSPRAVSWYDVIYIIGGNVDMVQLIDADTGSVSVSPDLLPQRNDGGSPIIVDAVLYVFGGFDNNGVTADWAYYPLDIPPTSSPTLLPSNNPTLPSKDPSLPPSKSPSNNPTVSPSNNPTVSPSKDPTVSPSINPIISPSDNQYLINTVSSINTSSPGKQTNTTPTVHITIQDTQNGQNQHDTNTANHELLNSQQIIYITVGGVILLVLVIAIGIYYRKNIKEKRKQMEKDVEIVEHSQFPDNNENKQTNEDSEGVTVHANINDGMDRRLTNQLAEGHNNDVVENVCMTRKDMIEDKIVLGVVSTKGDDTNGMSTKKETSGMNDV